MLYNAGAGWSPIHSGSGTMASHRQGVRQSALFMIQIVAFLIFGASLFFISDPPVLGQTDEAPSSSPRTNHIQVANQNQCAVEVSDTGEEPSLESVQVETSDLRLYERFFERFLGAHLVFAMDHPLVDQIRTYCYHKVAIAIRQDLKTPRPTGWVQINFLVDDLATVEQELKEAGQRLAVSEPGTSGEPYPIRIKKGVPRNRCRVDRVEISGPEGFMIGFHHLHKETCRPQMSGRSGDDSHATRHE